MKVIHINTNDMNGGAAIATRRIFQEMYDENINACLWVQQKNTDFISVYSSKNYLSKIKCFVNEKFERILKKIAVGSDSIHWSSGFSIFNLLKNIENDLNDYDVVHLHWINNGFLGINDLKIIKKPIVWTLHDSWLFTGGCHIPFCCNKYKNICFKCPQLKNLCFDMTKHIYKNKLKNLNVNITIVCPSYWLAKKAKESFLLKKYNIQVIHNGIDINKFKPRDKCFSRSILGLDKDHKIILFGAVAATSDKNKGFKYLFQAIKNLRLENEDRENIKIIVFGSSKPQDAPDFGFETYYLGKIYDEMSLNIIYSAADVVVVPSLLENLPNVILEAMACGTPCVAFDCGGIPEIIVHKKTGYLAKSYEIKDLADGIKFVLEDKQRWNYLSYASRKKIVRDFNIKNTVGNYLKLYSKIIN